MFLYWIRVVVISFEALVLLLAAMVWVVFRSELEAAASVLTLNEEFLKYMFVVPVGVGLWVTNESRLLLQEDKETIKILTAWQEYRLLKTHIWVGLLYALLFAALSILPWAAKSGVSSGTGLLLFLVAIAGQFIVAASVYSARIRLKEIIVHASAP